MRSTDNALHPSQATAAPDDQLEQLRSAFHSRLRSDRVRLTTFASALALTKQDAAAIFQDIQFFAHQLGGAAAIFEAAEVESAARAVEQAATAALIAHAGNSDAAVWKALENLADRLAIMNGKHAALANRALIGLDSTPRARGSPPRER